MEAKEAYLPKFTKDDIGKTVVLTHNQDGLLPGSTGKIISITSSSVVINCIKGMYYDDYDEETEDWSVHRDDSYTWSVRSSRVKLLNTYNNNDIILLLI